MVLNLIYKNSFVKSLKSLLGKKARNAARNIMKNALCLVWMKKGLYKNYLIYRSCENKRNVEKVEKVLKYELRRYEAADNIAEDLEDAATWYNSKILY